MDHIDNSLRPAAVPRTGTPRADYVMSEDDRSTLNEITLTVEFLMVAARALSLGFPKDHPEVAQYLTFARLKMPRVEALPKA